jgi:hypothetical protein
MAELAECMRVYQGASEGKRAYVGTQHVAELYENLATNPSMETASGTTEVRRNYALDPRAINAAGWIINEVGLTSMTSVTGSWTGLPNGTAVRALASGTGNANIITQHSTVPAVAAQVWAGSVYIYNEGASPMTVELWTRGFLGSTGVTNATSGATVIAPGTGQRLSAIYTVPGGVDNIRLNVRRSSGAAAQSYVVTGFLLEKLPVVGSYFDGTSTSPDSDLTRAWAGTADNSASTLTGAVVTNAVGYATLSFAVQSTQWAATGTKSVRIIPASASNDSFAEVPGMMPSASLLAGKTVTIRGSIRLAAAQAGSLFGNARKFGISIATTTGSVIPTLTYTSTATNAAGVYLVSATFVVPANATAWNFVRLYNGASAGNGDVWWDSVMLLALPYTGIYFDGTTPAAVGHGPAFWTGAAHASSSKLWSTPTP